MADKQWQVVNESEIKEKWPLHAAVFEDNLMKLQDLLKKNTVDLISYYLYFLSYEIRYLSTVHCHQLSNYCVYCSIKSL